MTRVPASGKHPLHEPMEWELFDADVPFVRVWLYHSLDVVWQIDAGADATSMTVPQPPSGVDTNALFGSSMRGRVIPYWLDDLHRAEAFSFSPELPIQP